jgi:hypothetical protein
MAKPFQTGVIDASTALDIRGDLLLLSGGKFNVFAGGLAANLGFKEPIPWGTVKSITKYAPVAGAYRTVKINFDSTAIKTRVFDPIAKTYSYTDGFVAGYTYNFVVKADKCTGYPNGYSKSFNIVAPDVSIPLPDRVETYPWLAAPAADNRDLETRMRDSLYNLMHYSGSPFTCTKVSTSGLTIAGNFGIDDVDNQNWTLTITQQVVGGPYVPTGINSAGAGTTRFTFAETHGFAQGEYIMIDTSNLVWTSEPSVGNFSPTVAYEITASGTKTVSIAYAFGGGVWASGGSVTKVATGDTVGGEYAKPYGTPEIIASFEAGYGTDHATYITYVIEHGVPRTSQQIVGYMPAQTRLFVNATETGVIAMMDAIIDGLVIPMAVTATLSNADPAVLDCDGTPHNLKLGDYVTLTEAAGTGRAWTALVMEITADDTASFYLDTSGESGDADIDSIFIHNSAAYYVGS